MLTRIVNATPLEDYKVHVRFDDGAEGTLDIAAILDSDFIGVFEPLKDAQYFKQVFVEHGTLSWPNGADLDPDVLYSCLTGIPIKLG